MIINESFIFKRTRVCVPGVWCRYRYEYEAAVPGAEQNPGSSEDAGPPAGSRVRLLFPSLQMVIILVKRMT